MAVTRILPFLLVACFLTLMGASPSVSQGLPPLPPNYLQPERAWIKEEGLPAAEWGQYNDTGRNKLNLTYRHSAVNLAYVIRSSDPSDRVNATFIVYMNVSASNGFNSTGHLFPGSAPCWTLTVYLSSSQTIGQYTYHLFIATFDPEGSPGIYQVRINLTGTLTGGSSWTSPDGNPNVPWMFFEVPSGAWDPVSISDQLGRFTPFFFDTPVPTTQFNATLMLRPAGNNTGSSTARFRWNSTDGTTMAAYDVPVYYLGDEIWAAQCIVAANASSFPPNLTHPYCVDVTVGPYYHASPPFYVYPAYAAIVPDTWVIEGPPAIVENGTVHFSWTGSDLDGSVIGYQYRMDSSPWIFTAETSKTFQGLSNGTHRFKVAAVDDDGIVDGSPDQRTFIVLLNSPPETWITAGPNATTMQRDITFQWTGSDPDGYVAYYEYKLDDSPWIATTATGVTLLNVSSGNHTFQVRSRDNKGLEDPTPAEMSFTILRSWCEGELERLNACIAVLEGRILELEERTANLTELLARAQEENLNLSAQIGSLEAERTRLLSAIEYLRQERSQLLDQVSSLSKDKADLLEALGTYMNLTLNLRMELEQLRSELAYLNQTMKGLQTENEDLRKMAEELQRRLAECQSQVPEANAAAASAFLGIAWLLRRRQRRTRRFQA